LGKVIDPAAMFVNMRGHCTAPSGSLSTVVYNTHKTRYSLWWRRITRRPGTTVFTV